MSSKLRSVVALVAMALLGWICATQSKSVAETKPGNQTGVPHLVQQWEYEDARFDALSAKALGSQGFELVTVYTKREGELRAVYKRKIIY